MRRMPATLGEIIKSYEHRFLELPIGHLVYGRTIRLQAIGQDGVTGVIHRQGRKVAQFKERGIPEQPSFTTTSQYTIQSKRKGAKAG